MNGSYSVKSGYLLDKGLVKGASNAIWKHVSSWKGPQQRVRQFLWAAVHNRLMTNDERHQRHFTKSSECALFVGESESLDHILRSFPMARQVWLNTSNIAESNEFFVMNTEDWWMRYISGKNNSLIFGLTCWLLWKARIVCLKESRRVRLVLWSRRVSGLVLPLLPTRGLRTSNGARDGRASLERSHGELHRDRATLSTRIVRAELIGVVIGLDRVWDMGIREMEVQTDSACVVKLLTDRMSGNQQHAMLIEKFKNISQRAWSVSVKFIYREANFLVDFLANKGHELMLGTHTI
ncbi:Putative ribonuclease H protein At1g65750, partial [Linum perenne]